MGYIIGIADADKSTVQLLTNWSNGLDNSTLQKSMMVINQRIDDLEAHDIAKTFKFRHSYYWNK